jgi:hypothetical protein
MWGETLMIMPGTHRDIRPYGRSTHLLVCLSAKKVFWTEFRQTSPARLLSKYVMTEYIHSRCILGLDRGDHCQE